MKQFFAVIKGKQAKQQEEELMKLSKENSDLALQLGQAREISRKDNLLVEEYNRRIHTLTGILEKNKAAMDESKDMKTKLSDFTKLTEKQAAQLTDLEVNLKAINELKMEQIKQQIERNKEDMERFIERKDLEKERELLGIRAEYQAKIEKINADDTEKLRGLYDEINKLRERFEVNNTNKGVKPKAE